MALSEKFSMILSNYIKKTVPNKTEEDLEIIRYGLEVLFMNITHKSAKVLAIKISDIAINIAYTSTQASIAYALEEPKLPKSLLKKAK
ncbi:accessory gene regulator B family protein [Clostridium algidicarnis]|uniref:accessory gene regulator B family protein n=1 Tax=Clostridium algidicarnis TaxID=37659 RepID=UPI001FE287DA|nr:accessory gene regulator B family protein [Clostridium algidicarnis]